MRKKGMSPETAENIRIRRGIDRGSKLRRMRVKKGLSQSELSDASGVPIKTIQEFEQRTGRIDSTKLNTLCSLCLALDCKIADIVEDEKLIAKYNKVK